MINAAVIGISGFGRIHYHDLVRQHERGQMRLLCATVVNQDDEREKCDRLRALGCELFTDHHAMLARHGSALNLCCIPTGIHQHAPMSIDVLRAGANVFVEKPAAATVQDVLAMREAERATGRFVAVGFQTMYARETLWMKRALLAGEIGPVRAIKCRGLWPRLDSYYERTRWAGRLRIDGHWVLDSPFNNAIAHQLNMVCFLAGSTLEEPARLATIEAELSRAHEIESADTAALRIVTSTGVPIYFFVTHCSEETRDPEIVVRGEAGELHWNFKTATIRRGDGTSETVPTETGDELRDSIMARLRERITGAPAFVCGLGIAGTHTLAVNGAHDSSPPHPIDPRHIRRGPAAGSVKTVIHGIDALIDRAFDEESLFSALGAEWSHPGRRIELEDYSEYPSR